MKILCIICARAGSKGLPGKNIRSLLGKPLIAHTIKQAISSGLFEHVVVSTDSSRIAGIAKKYKAEVPFLRPKKLAGDTCPKLPSIRHALLECEKLFNTKFDIIVDLDPTSPLRTIEDIRNCVEILIKKHASNVITAMPARRSPYFNLIEIYPGGRIGLSKKTKPPITCRQNSPKCFDMNASIYAWKRQALLKNDSLFLKKTALYVMPEERSIDIDNEIDFKFVEFLANRH
ncbi:MAG: acylneuraminate cytidylyltransferase family protein [Candidatus Omnitrophica bacterium]|nr:acylneuraminate cytidylyltransferase family protein [Candidatus Omnitrophota bacterium]